MGAIESDEVRMHVNIHTGKYAVTLPCVSYVCMYLMRLCRLQQTAD
jgi:hypothetical protein